ncbi:MAG TPA: PorV/PorQ family protein [Bacteroidota bacterium]
MRILRNNLSWSFAMALTFALAGTTAAQDQGTTKLAQTGMKFLEVGANARQTALGDAFTAGEGNSVSMFYNTAGMARLSSTFDMSVGQTQWLADIRHLYATVAWNLQDIGVFGVAAQYIDYGDIQQTILVDKSINNQGFLDVGTFKPWGAVIGVGYARALSDKFSVGGNIKWVKQDLGESYTNVVSFSSVNSDSNTTQKNTQSVYAFDFGVLYKTGIKSLAFGVAVRNFSREVTFQKESFQLPLTFKMGVAMNVLDIAEMDPASQSLMIAIDAEHPRDYQEQIRIGAEYLFANTVAIRLGYVTPADDFNASYGIGVQQDWMGTHMALDYSYTPYRTFDAVSRISLRFGF